LAHRSATAAKEIKILIDDAVNQTDEGRSLVEKADTAMQEMVTNVDNMAQVMSEIAQASHEQSEGIAQINQAVGLLDSSTQQNAALAEESTASAHSLQTQAYLLNDLVSVFKLNESPS
jgi:methyl-accepting chemotaxis protein